MFILYPYIKLKSPYGVCRKGLNLLLKFATPFYSAQRKTAFLLKPKMLKLNIKRELFVILAADIVLRLRVPK